VATKPKKDSRAQGELVPGPEDAPEQALVELAEPNPDPDPNDLTEETLLPVWKMVRLSRRELTLIDHPAFQRLFEVYQLGQTNLVYRGATHMRGEHAIGTVFAAMEIVNAVHRNRARREPNADDRWATAPELNQTEVAFIRLGALMHDIGHLPAGHTLEDELGLLAHHDGDERIELVLGMKDWHGGKTRSLAELIDELYAADAVLAAQRDEQDKPLSASQLLVRLISADHHGAQGTEGIAFRLGVCRDVIGNTICADLIDYLHRDWLHIGKPRNFDPRLLDYMQILTRTRQGKREDRLVIHLGKRRRPRPDAVTAILDLLESRYQLSEIALYHRVKLAAAAMLERAIAEYRDTFPAVDQRDALEALIPDLLQCSDIEVLGLLARKLSERQNASNSKRVKAAIDLTKRLRIRRLHRDLQILYADELGPPERSQLLAERYCGDPEKSGEDARETVRQAAENRLISVRSLEEDFQLPTGSIVMYCPPLQMNTKIAKVGIFRNGTVDSLDSLDSHGGISGGHLAAQKDRFRRLWRILFAIDPEVHDELEKADLLSVMRDAIEKVTLWTASDLEDEPDDAIRGIAETLVARPSSPYYECPIIKPALNREQEDVELPGGGRPIRSFIGQKTKKS
jgi:HD superfamily phosphohydrolase